MEEVALENKDVYLPGDVVSLLAVDLNKKNHSNLKRKKHFEVTYNGKLLRIEIKAVCGFVTSGLLRDKFIALETGPLGGFIWDIFNAIRN